jgi:hypothetical protein
MIVDISAVISCDSASFFVIYQSMIKFKVPHGSICYESIDNQYNRRLIWIELDYLA